MPGSLSPLLISKQSLAAEAGVERTTFRRFLQAAEKFFGFTTGKRKLLTTAEADKVREYINLHCLGGAPTDGPAVTT